VVCRNQDLLEWSLPGIPPGPSLPPRPSCWLVRTVDRLRSLAAVSALH
jgi:hypothetical protein